MKICGTFVVLFGIWCSSPSHAECSQQQVIALQQRGATPAQIYQICGNEPPPQASYPPPQSVSNRCFSQVGVCVLPGYGPIGASCWCGTQYGPSPGMVR